MEKPKTRKAAPIVVEGADESGNWSSIPSQPEHSSTVAATKWATDNVTPTNEGQAYRVVQIKSCFVLKETSTVRAITVK